MTGMILDAVLMLLLVAALGYGVRLERKLSQLRAGQLAFAGAVTELNAACTRAENALSSLRASGEEADLLHDRIIKARTLKGELEALVARGGRPVLARAETTPEATESPAILARPAPQSAAPTPVDPDDRAFRMAALAERIQGLRAPATPAAAGAGNVQAILHALTANQSAKQNLNRSRPTTTDDDLFAA